MSDENAYQALTEAASDGASRWAFGSGFDDPLAGVDQTAPAAVRHDDLAVYCTMLADDALVLSQRLIEWVTWAPELEDELALANIALDLLGQARLLFSRSSQLDGAVRGEDALAFFRSDREFRNVRLVEVPNGDFAHTIARLFVFVSWRLALFQRLVGSADPVLSAIASKGVKELTYHRDYAARWLVCLGDGTEVSHERMCRGLDEVWPWVEELFDSHPVERRLEAGGAGVLPEFARSEVDAVLQRVLDTATVPRPERSSIPGVSGQTGRDGVHTEHLGYVLAEMQSLARACPEGIW